MSVPRPHLLFPSGAGRSKTYHRSLEVLTTLLEYLERLLLVRSTADYGPDLGLADVLQDGPQLVGCGRILGDVQFELGAVGCRLGGVVAGLVLCGMLRSVGGGLLQQSDGSH